MRRPNQPRPGDWTPDQDARLRAAYASADLTVLAAELGRTRKAVTVRATRLDLGGARTRPWTPADDDLLCQQYPYTSIARLTQRLGRSQHAIRVRASRLGLTGVGNAWNLAAIAEALGVNAAAASQWARKGWLQTRCTRGRGTYTRHAVTDQAIHNFLCQHFRCWGKVQDQGWVDALRTDRRLRQHCPICRLVPLPPSPPRSPRPQPRADVAEYAGPGRVALGRYR